MASVIEMAEEHNEKFVLVDIMEYRVTDECLPIFIWQLSLPSAEKCHKCDGSVYTWAEYASDTLILRRNKSATTLVQVNGPYDLPYTIKDSERII